MKYIIIGGAGFIGSNFADKLLERGEQVTIFDNLSRNGSKINIEWLKNKYPKIKFVFGDIRKDISLLESEINENEVVFHLAGQVAVTTSIINPMEDFEINALGTLNVLEAVRKSNDRPIIIFSSTNKVYGEMEQLEVIEGTEKYEYKNLPNGINEKIPLDFHSPYGCSKGSADQYVRDYSRIFNIRSVVMRQSCIYGTRQFGVEDQGWVAWFTIAGALNKGINIYGDGKQVRDVLFVDDLFNAWDLAVKNINKSNGQIYNIGGGSKMSMSLLELIKYLEKFFNKKIPLKYCEWRAGDQKIYISDINKAKIDLGWEPIVTPENGVKKLYDWVQSNINLFE